MFWITIDQIMCFQAVIEEGSFTKASEKLMRAKSAVRYAVNNLEEQLGFRLLDRDHYRPKVTVKGEAFLYRSKKILNEYTELETFCRQISSEVETRLALSVSDIYEMKKIYPLMRSAMENFPSTEIVLEREILSGEQLLLSEQVDIAIYAGTGEQRQIDRKQIDEIHLVLVIGKDHPFLNLPKAERDLSALYRYPQIFQRSTINDHKDHGTINQDFKWKVTDTASKKELIINSFGWGRLPIKMIENDIDQGDLIHLKEYHLDEVIPVYAGKRKKEFMGKVAQFIWDQL